MENIDFDINLIDKIGEESEQKEEKVFTIEDFISISVSRDKMEAYISTIPIIDDNIILTLDILKYLLYKNNVVSGIEFNKLQEIVDSRDCSISLKVASGKRKIDGKDGYLTYHFDAYPSSKPKLLEDGSVDFRNLNIIQNVDENQVLLTYTPPTDGIDGYMVTGEVIPAKAGKSVLLPKGKRVKVSEDGLQLLAEREGNVEIIEGKVSVSNTMTINGNVDVSTGNIYFNGDIVIMGNVVAGFTVTAVGSISVEGFVEASVLKAEGDIILKNGIQGAGRGKLTADGNIATKFIEMAEIYAKGNITTNAVMNSTLESESDIIVSGKRGYIIGGITKALNRIQATGLGNMSEIPTPLEVGFSEENSRKMGVLEQDIEKLAEELAVIETNMNNFKPTMNKIELMRAKIEKSAKYTASVREFKRLRELRDKMDTPKVDVERTIHVGSIIFIKSDIFKVKSPMRSTSFRFGSSKKIVTISYTKE